MVHQIVEVGRALDLLCQTGLPLVLNLPQLPFRRCRHDLGLFDLKSFKTWISFGISRIRGDILRNIPGAIAILMKSKSPLILVLSVEVFLVELFIGPDSGLTDHFVLETFLKEVVLTVEGVRVVLVGMLGHMIVKGLQVRVFGLFVYKETFAVFLRDQFTERGLAHSDIAAYGTCKSYIFSRCFISII